MSESLVIPWGPLADPSMASESEVEVALRCVAELHARAAGLVAPTDLLFLLVITAPLLVTPDLIMRAVAWRAPGPGQSPPPPLDRPADETWHLLCTWRRNYADPDSQDARRALAWIFGSGTTESPEHWAGGHPRVARVAYEILDAGGDRAAEALGLGAVPRGAPRRAALARVLTEPRSAAALRVGSALPLHRNALLEGRLYDALHLLLDATSELPEERSALAVAEADVLRRLGLLDLADARLTAAEDLLVGVDAETQKPLDTAISVARGRLALASEALPETCKGQPDRASRLIWALAARPRAADVALVALRADGEVWDLADQFRFSWAVSWLANLGWMGDGWSLVRRDAAEWTTEDPALCGLWQRLARRTRPSSEDLRAWLERCPV